MNKGNLIIAISTIMIIIALSGCNSVIEDNEDAEPLVTDISNDISKDANEDTSNSIEDEVKNDEKARR